MKLCKYLLLLFISISWPISAQISPLDCTSALERQTLHLLDSIQSDTSFDFQLSNNVIIECYWTKEEGNRLGIMCLPVRELRLVRMRSESYKDTNWMVYKAIVYKSVRVYFMVKSTDEFEYPSLHDYLKTNDPTFYNSIYTEEPIILSTYNPRWFTQFLNDPKIYTISDWDLMMHVQEKHKANSQSRYKSIKLE